MTVETITCQYLGVQDSYCGYVHTSLNDADRCRERSHDPRGFGWATVTRGALFYDRRWGRRDCSSTPSPTE